MREAGAAIFFVTVAFMILRTKIIQYFIECKVVSFKRHFHIFTKLFSADYYLLTHYFNTSSSSSSFSSFFFFFFFLRGWGGEGAANIVWPLQFMRSNLNSNVNFIERQNKFCRA